MASRQGIDVSHYQGDIDWVAVQAAGIEFAFIKATDGITNTDPKFTDNWSRAQLAGVSTGAYHFFRPEDDPMQQAQHFIATFTAAGFSRNNLPMALDVEVAGDVGSADLLKSVSTILAAIEQATQVTPLIYTAPSFWDTAIGASLNHYPLWIANWTSSSTPTLPGGWSDWQYWQYSESGTVAGISGPVDMNRG
jgi:lysozyme